MALETTGGNVHQSLYKAIRRSLGALYERRWLTLYFIRRQVLRRHKNSFLGPVWIVLTPLLMVALYTLIFSEIIGLRFRAVEGDSTLNFGLYVYCGLIPFMAFSESFGQAAGIIRANAGLIQKVLFPTEILPLSSVATGLFTHSAGLGVLVVMVAVLEGRLNATLALLPLIIILQLIFMLGISYLVAVIGAYLPDLQETAQSVTRVLFFVTPIIWPVSLVPEHLRWVVDLNPLAFLVGAYRDLVLNGELPDMRAVLYFSLFSGVLLAVGLVLFARSKRKFADLV